MNKILKNIIFILCFIPLILKLPYLIESWKWSIIERDNMYIWLMLPLISLACELVRRFSKIGNYARTYRKFLIPTIVASAIIWILISTKINAGGVLFSIFILALGVEFRFGRGVFVGQTPMFFAAILACPSISYWVDYYLHLGIDVARSYFFWKMAIICMFFISWSVRAILKRRYPRISNILFCVVILIAFMFAKVQNNSLESAGPYYINLEKLKDKNWIGVIDEPTLSDIKFFSNNSKINRRTYYGKSSIITLLSIGVKNVSDIHPIGICLKNAGIVIESSVQNYVELDNKKIQVNELIVRINGDRFMVYSIFTNKDMSTGDFKVFRFSKDKSVWTHYQIMISADDSLSDTRNALKDYLLSFQLKNGNEEQKSPAK